MALVVGATMSSRVQKLVKRDVMIDYCSLSVEDQNLRGVAWCDLPSPWKVTSLVTMATKNQSHQNWKIFVPFERAWKTDWKKGHNLHLKKNIPGDINELRQNDVMNYDVIEKLKMVKMLKFLVHLKENLSGNKKYYYQKVWKSF